MRQLAVQPRQHMDATSDVDAQVRFGAVDVDLVVRAVEVAAHDDRLALAQRLQVRRKVPVPLADPILQPPQTLPCEASQRWSVRVNPRRLSARAAGSM